LDLILRGYYVLIDACENNRDWKLKIEEEVGQQINYMLTNIEDDDISTIKTHYPSFERFVRILHIYLLYFYIIGRREAKVL
jgi:hypothetical protein